MAATSERFNKAVVDAIAKRAANLCSNPDCVAMTIGPAIDDEGAVNVGEAAHIYGARPGSARYLAEMSDESRSDITNAIWLCRNCHKQVDTDIGKFPPELLFEWRRAHEHEVAQSLGKAGAGALLREKTTTRLLERLEGCSYLAQQIIIDKPVFWEYRLTSELLRDWLEPIKFRWDALNRGLYFHPLGRIPHSECATWHQEQLQVLSRQVSALAALTSGELTQAWGSPGQPGFVRDIHRVCALITEACRQILEWEERMRFCQVPENWKEAKSLLMGIGGPMIQSVFEIASNMAAIVSQPNPTGMHTLKLNFSIPDELVRKFLDAVQRAKASPSA